MRQRFVFRDKVFQAPVWEDDTELMEIHDGLVLKVVDGFSEAATYCDGTMSHWTLAINNGSVPDRHFAFMFPHSEFLPVYFLHTAHDLVSLLKYLEATLVGTSIDDDLYE